jgi:hypothetical protein
MLDNKIDEIKSDKKEQILSILGAYVDETNRIDISKFRAENASEYSLIPHYFGGVNKLINDQGWIKVIKTYANGNKATLRDQLAYDMLKDLRKDKTLEEIAKTYNVSRAGINQLFKALEGNINEDAE